MGKGEFEQMIVKFTFKNKAQENVDLKGGGTCAIQY